MKNDTVGTKTA